MRSNQPAATRRADPQLEIAWDFGDRREGGETLPPYVRDALYAILERGTATADEVSARLNMPHQSASAAVTKLYQAGWIEDAGRRRATRRGRSAVVWQVVQVPSGEQRKKVGNRMAAMCARLREEARDLCIAALHTIAGLDEARAAQETDELIESRRVRSRTDGGSHER